MISVIVVIILIIVIIVIFVIILISRKAYIAHLGKDPATKTDEFLEKFQTAFDIPPSFLENYIAIFPRKTSEKSPL